MFGMCSSLACCCFRFVAGLSRYKLIRYQRGRVFESPDRASMPPPRSKLSKSLNSSSRNKLMGMKSWSLRFRLSVFELRSRTKQNAGQLSSRPPPRSPSKIELTSSSLPSKLRTHLLLLPRDLPTAILLDLLFSLLFLVVRLVEHELREKRKRGRESVSSSTRLVSLPPHPSCSSPPPRSSTQSNESAHSLYSHHP